MDSNNNGQNQNHVFHNSLVAFLGRTTTKQRNNKSLNKNPFISYCQLAINYNYIRLLWYLSNYIYKIYLKSTNYKKRIKLYYEYTIFQMIIVNHSPRKKTSDLLGTNVKAVIYYQNHRQLKFGQRLVIPYTM